MLFKQSIRALLHSRTALRIIVLELWQLKAESCVGFCMGRLCFTVFTAGNITLMHIR